MFNILEYLRLRIKGTTPASDTAGEIEVDSATGKLNYHDGTSRSPAVTEAHAATLTNKTFNADGAGNSITNIENADIKAGAAIDAAKIADGSVSNDEFQHISSLSFNAQSQLTTNATAISDHLADAVDAHAGTAITNTPAGTIAATTVQAALNELDGDIQAHIVDAVDAHDASAISITAIATIAATEVQGALAELQSDIADRALSSTLTAHTDTTVAHGATGAVVGTTNTQVLTNKDYDGGVATDTRRFTLPKATKATLDGLTRKEGTIAYATDTDKVYRDDGSSLFEIGSGAGTKNYITNSDAEVGTTGWVTYADAAGVAPVDGTGNLGGGSPFTTFARNTSSPLSSTGDFLITKDAPNRQGEGASFAFTIDLADRASILRVTFDYATSVNFVDGDYRVYVYDVTNASMIELDRRDLMANTLGHYLGSFQTSSNSTSYRLIFHCATVNATAGGYTINIDSVVVGPSQITRGPVITDWVACTFLDLTVTSWGGLASSGSITNNLQCSRVGPNLRMRGSFTLGTVGAALGKIPLPTNYGTLTTVSNIATNSSAGLLSRAVASAAVLYNSIINPSTLFLQHSNSLVNSTINPITAVNGSAAFGNGDVISFHGEISIPITGWGVNQVVSEDHGTRLIAVQLSGSAVATALNTPIIFTGVANDTTGSYNTTTGRFTVPESGWYRVTLFANGTLSINEYPYVSVNANTTAGINRPVLGIAYAANLIGGSALVFVKKGDFIDIRPSANLGSLTNFSTASIEKLSGNQQIAASEIVKCKYTTNTAIAVTGGSIIIFEDVDNDSHGAYSVATGLYTAPVSGDYLVSATMFTNPVSAGAAGQVFAFRVQKQGSNWAFGRRDYSYSTTGRAYTADINTVVPLLRGETISFVFEEDIPAVNLSADRSYNYMSITRIGGVA